MDIQKTMERAHPFGALIGVSSLIAAILFVAGFSYKWSYYYNFGVQHLVFQQNVQAFLITSIELIRQPKSLWFTFLFILCPLIVLNFVIATIRRASQSAPEKLHGKIGGFLTRVLGLDSPLVVDAIRAGLVVYACFMVSAELGYAAFRSHIIESHHNPLPRVSLVFDQTLENGELPLACGASEEIPFQFIGNAKILRTIQESFRTCNSPQLTWRLLYRDAEAIYVFASQPKGVGGDGRPLTLIVPNDGKTFLVME